MVELSRNNGLSQPISYPAKRFIKNKYNYFLDKLMVTCKFWNLRNVFVHLNNGR